VHIMTKPFFLMKNYSHTKTKTQALMRLALDFGDRRVLAGVSFPSDIFAAGKVINSLLANQTAWPRASEAHLKFPTSNSERDTLCGDTYPLLCSSVGFS
jgi:hypothetical protein